MQDAATYFGLAAIAFVIWWVFNWIAEKTKK
jgi:hypothetical protein